MLKAADLKEIVALEPQAKKLKYYLMDKYDTFLTNKDVNNLKARYKSNEEIFVGLKIFFNQFVHEQKNIAKIGHTEDGHISYIYVQISEAKYFFKKYGEILMIDSTYRLNSLNMPVYIFMASDQLGNGRVVAAAVVASETCEILEEVFSEFASVNNSENIVKTIIVDKDLSEINAIKKIFKQANVFLCLFHVIKAFIAKVTKTSHHNSVKQKAINIFQEMLYCCSEDIYKKIAAKFQAEKPSDLVCYFNKNWNKCSEIWSGYALKDIIINNETTNNKVESKNGALKQLINATDSIVVCIEKLARFMKDDLQIMEYRKIYKDLTVDKNSQEHHLLKKIKLTHNTQAIKITKKNFKILENSKFEAFCVDDQMATIKICNQNESSTSTINISLKSCECRDFLVSRIPCIHIIAADILEIIEIKSDWLPENLHSKNIESNADSKGLIEIEN